MIEAVELTRRYGDVAVVDSVNLSVPAGAFFGFLGPNGAGKSTTIRMLSGALSPTSGTVRVCGVDVAGDPMSVKRLTGVMPEEPALYEKLTASEFLEFAGRMYGLSQPQSIQRASDLMEMLDLIPARSRLIGDYSMGMRKKTALAAALIHRPRVLFLDEPFNGMDTLAVQTIGTLLRGLVDGGATVFFSSHILETVEKLCSRVAILLKGKIVAEGTVAELRELVGAADGASLEEIYFALTADRVKSVAPGWLS